MARSGSFETPLLRVSRPVAACSRCRSAKIKCDGKLPACTACEKTGRETECSSSNDQFARGKERSYVASLESRVEKLEKKLAYARLRKASVSMHEADDEGSLTAGRKDSMATIRAAIHGKAARRREATDVNELVSDFGFLSVNATTRDFETSSTKMTFAKLILAASINEPMPKSKSDQLPSRPAAMLLVQYYLDNVHALFPAFPDTALFNALDAIYQIGGRPVAGFEYWLLYMVLGIGAMGQSRSRKDAYYKDGVSWVARALNYVDVVLVPGTLIQMQALVLFVQYSMLDPAHFDSWQLIGFACRAVVDLGYHQDPPKEQSPDKQALEQRRRLYWSIYCLDRSISMVHARSFSFTDDATSVALPATPNNIPPTDVDVPLTGPHSVQTALLLSQLRRAQSSWYQELFQSSREELDVSSTYVWRMCYDMRTWFETLPNSLAPAVKGLFELELLYSYIYCLAPSCRVPAVSDLGKTLIYEYSMQYVEKIYAISQDPINTGFYTYHDALRVFFIGSQFLAVLKENPDGLLNGVRPYIPSMQGGPPPPQIPNLGRHDNIERSIACIGRFNEVLETYGERWNDSKALEASFDMQAEPVLNELQQRQHIRDSASSQGSIGSYSHRSSSGQYDPRMQDWLQGSLLAPSNIQQVQYGNRSLSISLESPPQQPYSQGSSPRASYQGQNESPQAFQTFHGSPQGYFTGNQASPQASQQQQQPPFQISPQNSYLGQQQFQNYQQ